MLTYLILGLWISSSLGSPIQSQKSGPLVYYSPAASPYVQSNLYPFVQYPSESPAFGKALQSYKMLTYLILGLWISSSLGSPIQSQKSGPLVYYSPAASPYVQSNLYPFVQYPSESPAFGKALQSIPSQNELLFYPSRPVLPQQIQQPVIVNTQNAPSTRFTAPPNGLVDAIYAWFAENNVPIPDDPSRNEASLDIRDQEKPENTDKTAGEAEILAEAEKNPNLHFPKKPISPKFHPGQRFYILNGQPQFFSNYQPAPPRVQPVIPQLLTRSAIPGEQNILFLQPQAGLKNQDINLQAQPTQEQTNQNVVLVQDQVQPDVKPVRYHSTELKPQNYIFFRENQQQENRAPHIQVQPYVPTYSRQQLLIGRLLPQTQDIKQQQVQTPNYQTHYVPVEVVPPQAPQFQTAQVYQNQNTPQQEDQHQPQLAFIHIPVDRNVQPPQYITTKAPAATLQQPSSGKQYLYLSSESQPIQQRVETTENQVQPQSIPNQRPEVNNDELAPGIAALEFARYISSRQGDLYSDSVVIDAKSDDDDNKDQEDSDSVQTDVHQEPSIAQAQPGGIALAGPGGVAATAPRGTAFVGEKGLAIASPQATAVAGPHPSKEDKEKGL